MHQITRFLFAATLLFGVFAGVFVLVAREGPAASWVGEYRSHGDDAASGSWLTLLPNGDYALVYFGGMQQGTWRTRPGGELELREWKDDSPDFLVYGRYTSTLGDTVRLQFDGFSEGWAKVGLSAASQGQLLMQPAFNTDANCVGYPYRLKRVAGTLPKLYLAAYKEAGMPHYDTSRLTKQLLYAFTLPTRYNDYQVSYSEWTSAPGAVERAYWHNQELQLTYHGYGGASYGRRHELQPKNRQEMEGLIAGVRQPPPAEATIRLYNPDTTYTYFRLPDITRPLRPATVRLGPPLFVARCDGTN